MAEIRAFRAHRYDLARVGMLGEVVAPPYDVIDPKMQQELYDKSPYNVIRLILNKEEPTDNDSNNRYTRSAKCLREWQHDNVLVQDPAKAIYVYHQEFEVEGKKYNRRGFLTRVRLEKFGEGKIYPHEQTMSGPKADRLKLFHATGMNLSPIFGLFPDETNEVQDLLDKAVGRGLPLEATDHLGVVSRLWAVTDTQIVSQVTGLMSPRPIFIADGHHRYETSLKYLEEKTAAGEVTDEDHAANFCMMMLVGMSDPGLTILPTHRLISGIGDLTSAQLRDILKADFECDVVGTGDKAANDAWELIEADGGQSLLAFGTADGTWITARFKSPEKMKELAGDHSEAWRGLGVSILHVLVLGKLLPEALSASEISCKYVHLVSEVNEAMANKQCQLSALVAPASMEHVEEIAGNLEKMPPKSTYFYPKLLSGLLFNSLKVS